MISSCKASIIVPPLQWLKCLNLYGLLQFMVNGAVGLPGKVVLFPVMLASRRDTERAPIQYPLFMATTVLVMQQNTIYVINQLVVI